MAKLRLENKACLITGGARGIGAATARLFAREGARVAIVDVKDELGEGVTAAIEKAGGRALYRHCDVTRSAEVAAAVQSVVETFGTLDVLLNNAGTAIEGGVEKLTEEDWDRTFAINLKSMFLCSKFVIPMMRKGGGGSIIHMASESGSLNHWIEDDTGGTFPIHDTTLTASDGAHSSASGPASSRVLRWPHPRRAGANGGSAPARCPSLSRTPC